MNNSEIWDNDGIQIRFMRNPILEAIVDHKWESKRVYNCAAFRLENIIYLIYRAFGDDNISRLGLAWTKNGTDIDVRLPFHVFEPKEIYEIPSKADSMERTREKGGCEDPPCTVIGSKIFMVYTAYSKFCQ